MLKIFKAIQAFSCVYWCITAAIDRDILQPCEVVQKVWFRLNKEKAAKTTDSGTMLRFEYLLIKPIPPRLLSMGTTQYCTCILDWSLVYKLSSGLCDKY